MKVETAFIIEGRQVHKVLAKGDVAVYEPKSQPDDENVQYITVKDTVIMKNKIKAECNQDFGLISLNEWTGVN